MKKILAPHKEQDGWVYVRLAKSILSTEPLHLAPDDDPIDIIDVIEDGDDEYIIDFAYFDDRPGSRIISSRRVELAVETDDFLRLCAEEGLWAGMDCAGDWCVAKSGTTVGNFLTGPIRVEFRSEVAVGATLREAYYRYHAAVDA